MDITQLSRNMAKTFGENLGYTEEKTDLLRFGFEIIIGEGLKLAVLIAIALIYDILPEMLSIIITFLIFRFVSGGAHSNSHEGCLVMTTLFFTGIALVSSNCSSVPGTLLVIAFIISAIAITLWAPAENKNRPIKPEKREKLKILSYILLVVWALGVSIATNFSIFYSGVVFASALAVILQAFILSPAGFRLMEYTDVIIKGRGGENNA
jgi:accessory gene regulator B